MFDFEDVENSDFPALDWALHLPGIRDGRGAIDHAAHRVLTYLARKGDWKTGMPCFPSVQGLADALDTDESFTRKKLGFLVELGLIRRMDVEEVAECLEQRKADQGKTAMTSWGEMAGGTREYYEERFDPQRGGQTAYALNIMDEDLWERMEKQKYERKETGRAKALDRHKRHNNKRYGTPPPEARRASQSPAKPKTAPKLTVVREVRDVPAQPQSTRAEPAPRRAFDRGVQPSLAESTPVLVDDTADRLMDLVLPQLSLDKTQSRRAHTVLMAFADRWRDLALPIAELAIELAPQYEGDMELGCFEPENDRNFADPLVKKIETLTKEDQPCPK